MKFGPISLEQAEGKILAHNIAAQDGRRAFRKGKPLTADDVAALRQLGRSVVYVAEPAADDVDENAAARRVATAAKGEGLRLVGSASGRVNLLATAQGVLRVDVVRLNRINGYDGITVATIASNATVRPRKMAATVKIIPFAVPENSVREVEAIAAESGALIHLDELSSRTVGLILSGSPSVRKRLIADFAPLSERVEALGSEVVITDYVPLEDDQAESMLAQTLSRQRQAGAQLIILAGETAIMDRHDLAPRAVERAGGHVESLGAPVDPGNLLMLAYMEEVPILGAPGCARSRKINIVDWILPRLLVGERLTRADIAALGHGGLLEDVPERPMPRSRLEGTTTSRPERTAKSK